MIISRILICLLVSPGASFAATVNSFAPMGAEPSFFLDPSQIENLQPTPELVDRIDGLIFGPENPRFAVLEIPLALLAAPGEDAPDFALLHRRAAAFKMNILKALVPRLPERIPGYPGKDFIPISGGPRVYPISKDPRPYHLVHWDPLSHPVLGLTYHHEPGLVGGELIVSDLAAYQKQHPTIEIGIYPPHLYTDPEAHQALLSPEFSRRIAMGAEHATVVFLNNVVDLDNPENTGVMHGVEELRGEGTKRVDVSGIADGSYSFDVNKPYVPPSFERLIGAEKAAKIFPFEDFYIARTGRFQSDSGPR